MKYKYIYILIALFFLQFLFVNPVGNFALNDDWVQADSVQHMVETGVLRIMPFAGATFHAQILYGAAWARLFGFSFTVLRFSVLALMLGTILLYYILLKKILRPQLAQFSPDLWAFLGTLLLWFNPIVYNLSFTFMTDIPALFLLVLSMLLYYAGFEKISVSNCEISLDEMQSEMQSEISPNSAGRNTRARQAVAFFFWGSIMCVIGAYVRQTNILLLPAAALPALFQKKYAPQSLRLRPIQYIIAFVLPLAMATGVYFWLNTHNLLPQTTNSHFVQGTVRWLGHIKWWTWYIPIYMGLFLLPFASGWIAKNKKSLKNKTFWIVPTIFVFAALAIRQIFHLQLPYILNMIHIYGLGPMNSVMDGHTVPLFGAWSSKIWGALTLISAASAGCGLNIFLKKRCNRPALYFIYLFGALYAITLLLFESFDRYIIMLVPVLTIALFAQTLAPAGPTSTQDNQLSPTWTILPVTLFAVFAITQTQFYMNWNAVRWQLANQALAGKAPVIQTTATNQQRADLLSAKITSEPNKNKPTEPVRANQIDAGYEWNGWHTYWQNAALGREPTQEPKSLPWWIRGLFFDNTREYMVAWSPAQEYTTILSAPVQGLNPNNEIFLLLNKKSAEGMAADMTNN